MIPNKLRQTFYWRCYLKYGEKLTVCGWKRQHHALTFGFRYRIDPVPYISTYRNSHVGGNRMHVMNEKRQYEKSLRHLIRGKRRPTALPDPWDYWNIANEQIHGWKRSKKAKQYM